MSKYNCIEHLLKLNISWDDAHALRRIAMTLQRVHELECGDSNSYCSWSLTRGHKAKDGTFTYDDDGNTYLEVHPHHGEVRYQKTPDRERGAYKRLSAIMERYPELTHYIQGDPRGCPLYIAKKSDIEGKDMDIAYNRGIAVCK